MHVNRRQFLLAASVAPAPWLKRARHLLLTPLFPEVFYRLLLHMVLRISPERSRARKSFTCLTFSAGSAIPPRSARSGARQQKSIDVGFLVVHPDASNQAWLSDLLHSIRHRVQLRARRISSRDFESGSAPPESEDNACCFCPWRSRYPSRVKRGAFSPFSRRGHHCFIARLWKPAS